jgi:hypothetical protein
MPILDSIHESFYKKVSFFVPGSVKDSINNCVRNTCNSSVRIPVSLNITRLVERVAHNSLHVPIRIFTIDKINSYGT